MKEMMDGEKGTFHGHVEGSPLKKSLLFVRQLQHLYIVEEVGVHVGGHIDLEPT